MNVLRDFAESPEAEQRSFFNGLRVYHETTFEHIRAMRLLILQSCGFNGLYRVNKSGVYNVPFSRKATFDFNMLREAAELLRPVSARCRFAWRCMLGVRQRLQ